MTEQAARNAQWDAERGGQEPSSDAKAKARKPRWRRVWLVVLAAALILSGSLGYSYYIRATDPLIAGIPPKLNADGTVDYTLVHKWLYDKEPYYWTLRLPQDQMVEESGDPIDVQLIGGPSYTFNSRKNRTLYLHFKSDSIPAYVRKEKDYPFHLQLHVSLNAGEEFR